MDIAITTPLNTIGMGDVLPGVTDGIPNKTPKLKRKKMKSLKDFIKTNNTHI